MGNINNANNWCLTGITFNNSNNPKVQEQQKIFFDATVSFLEKVSNKFKEHLESMAIVMSNAGKKTFVNDDVVHTGIKYKADAKKRIKCFMAYEKIISAMKNTSLSIQLNSDEAKNLNIDTSTGISIKSMKNGNMEKYYQAVCEKKLNDFFEFIGDISDEEAEKYGIEPVNTDVLIQYSEDYSHKRDIYEYFEKLDINDCVSIYNDNVNYMNVLLVATNEFTKKYENSDIAIRILVAHDGLMEVAQDNIDDDISSLESYVDVNFLMQNPEKKWYTNFNEIMITPYMSSSENDNIKIEVEPFEQCIQFGKFSTTAEEIVESIDILAKAISYNSKNTNCDFEDPRYMPHVYIEDEEHEIDNIMIASDDLELLEIPLNKEGSGTQMLLTRYM